MLWMILAGATPFLLEAPGYANEALRVERHSAWDRSVEAVVVRNLGTWAVKVDYIATTWSGSRIRTFDLSQCKAMQPALTKEGGPSAFISRESSVPGVVVIVPDGPFYSATARPPYLDALGAGRMTGSSLTPFGQWANAVLEAAALCPAR